MCLIGDNNHEADRILPGEISSAHVPLALWSRFCVWFGSIKTHELSTNEYCLSFRYGFSSTKNTKHLDDVSKISARNTLICPYTCICICISFTTFFLLWHHFNEIGYIRGRGLVLIPISTLNSSQTHSLIHAHPRPPDARDSEYFVLLVHRCGRE